MDTFFFHPVPWLSSRDAEMALHKSFSHPKTRYSLGPNAEFPGEGNDWPSEDQLPPLMDLTTGLGREVESMQRPGKAYRSCMG